MKAIVITTSIVVDADVGMLVLILGADDDDVVTADEKAASVAAHTGPGASRDTLDETIGGVLEPTPPRLLRRHVARPDSDEGAHSDGRIRAHVEALRYGRARIVEYEVARRGERGRGQRGGQADAQHQDRSSSFDHRPGSSRFHAAECFWGRPWGCPEFHPQKAGENNYIGLGLNVDLGSDAGKA